MSICRAPRPRGLGKQTGLCDFSLPRKEETETARAAVRPLQAPPISRLPLGAVAHCAALGARRAQGVVAERRRKCCRKGAPGRSDEGWKLCRCGFGTA